MADISDSLSNRIAYTVDEAVDAGVNVQDFVRCVKQCWLSRLHDRSRWAENEFDEMLRTKVK